MFRISFYILLFCVLSLTTYTIPQRRGVDWRVLERMIHYHPDESVTLIQELNKVLMLPPEQVERALFEFVHDQHVNQGRSENFDEHHDHGDLSNAAVHWPLLFKRMLEHNHRYKQRQETHFVLFNNFSFMSVEERRSYLGLQKPEEKDLRFNNNITQAYVASSFDWRSKSDVVKPVRNQGGCGSCYAFAALAAVEGATAIKYGQSELLSVQEAIECTNKCEGGNDNIISNYLYKHAGAAFDSDNPYDYTNFKPCGSWWFGRQSKRAPHSYVKNFEYAYSWYLFNEYSMRWAVANKGPLYAPMQVFTNFYDG